jgi:hypothetical protein
VGDDSKVRESKGIEMVTIIGIILADVIVILLFIYHYRQELGLTASGSSDKPVPPKKPAYNRTAPASTAEDQAKGSQVVTSEGPAAKRAAQRKRRNA